MIGYALHTRTSNYSNLSAVRSPGAANGDASMSTSSNVAYGMVSHDPQEGGQRHEYELVALNQPQTQHTSALDPSQKHVCPHAIPQTETWTQEPVYELMAGQ